MQRESFLAKLAVNRPVTITVTLIAILVVGIVAYQKIPIELLPSGFNPPFMGVWIPYPNANPQEVEEQIARPIEEEVRTIPGLKKVETYSQSNGCWAWMEFSQGTNMDLAYDQLRDRMERARTKLPEDVERYFLRKFGRNDQPIIYLSISMPPNVEDPFYIVDHYVKRPIERIDGVATIDIWGAYEKAIQILIDQDKVKAYNLNMYDLINRLRRDNFAISSGWVSEGGKKYMVRSVGRFKTLEDVQNMPLNTTGLKISDVAEVTYDVVEKDWYQRVNGRPAFKLEIFKESMANTVALSHKLRSIIDKEIRTNPALENSEITILFAQGDYIEDSIDNLIDTAIWGGLFAILVLFFFLRNFRMTFIMMFAIPLSVLISLTVTYFVGWTLNTVTMMGLMISVGMVVDNSIVVLENIYRKRNEGLAPRKASIIGSSEVSLAVIMATFTSIVVFLPMILIKDQSGFFSFYLKRIGLPVIFALLGSLFVALVLIPLSVIHFAATPTQKEWGIITRTKLKYQSALRWVLAHRLDTVLVIVGIMVLTFGYLAPRIPKSDMMGGNISDFRLMFEMPKHFSLDDANAFFKEVEDTIFAHSEEYRIRAVDTRFRKTFGRVVVFLQPEEKGQWYHTVYRGLRSLVGGPVNKSLDKNEILESLKKRLPQKPGVKFRTSWRGSSEGGDEGTVSVLLYGQDTQRLAELAEEVERRMRLLPGVLSVETDREAGEDEINVILDRETARKNGINPNQVAYTLMYALRGINLSRFQAQNKEIEMRIQVKESDRENLEQLKNFTFTNREGRAIPLSAFARFSINKGFGQIVREDGKTFLAVKALTSFEDLRKISARIDQIMKDFPMPAGYSWQKGQRFRRMEEEGQSFQQAIMVAVIFVFILMGILFESFVLPLSVLIAIPLSLFGAFLALFITNTPQDIMASIGLIILVGVVVNNAIVLIDMINTRRIEGYSRYDAILDAGLHRFRPILMTSLTTIGGLIPMALGNAALIGIPYAPMGRAIIGGMLTSTLLTLLAVPVLYTLFDDLSVYFKRLATWLRREPQAAAAEGD